MAAKFVPVVVLIATLSLLGCITGDVMGDVPSLPQANLTEPTVPPSTSGPDDQANNQTVPETTSASPSSAVHEEQSSAKPEPADNYGPSLSFDPSSRYLAEFKPVNHTRFKFTPNPDEVQAKRMEVRYNPVKDLYHRSLAADTESHSTGEVAATSSNWQRGLWWYYNIERTVEKEHNYVYLAREDTTSDNIWRGFIEYRFDLRSTGLKVKNLTIRLSYKTYRDGDVLISMSSANNSASNYTIVEIPEQSLVDHPVEAAQGWDDFVIRVSLYGTQASGSYTNAYQNAQLFREPTGFVGSASTDPFKVVVELS